MSDAEQKGADDAAADAGCADSARADSGNLSAEEQMARFEESLKNEDWGHQPC